MKTAACAFVVITALACAGVIKTPPLTAFPAPVAGEVDPVLAQIKTAFEADFQPKATVLRVESGDRTWKVHKAPTGVTTARSALVHIGFQVNDKCYYQPREVFQDAAGADWGAIKLGSWRYAYSKEKNLGHPAGFKSEALSKGGSSNLKSDAVPIDCPAINQTGSMFRRCETRPDDVCEAE